MAQHSSSHRKSQSRRARGRHRRPSAIDLNARTLCGAGALTFGIGAAAFLGAGAAHADAPSSTSASPDSSSGSGVARASTSNPASLSSTPAGAASNDSSADYNEQQPTGEGANPTPNPSPEPPVSSVTSSTSVSRVTSPATTSETPRVSTRTPATVAVTVPSSAAVGSTRTSQEPVPIAPPRASGVHPTPSATPFSGATPDTSRTTVPPALAALAASAPVTRATHESTGDGVFLGGKFIELGVSPVGSFGTNSAPVGFHPQDGRLGFTTDLDGFGSGTDDIIDFFTPDTPEERWSIGYNNTNNAGFSQLDGSSGGKLSNVSLVDSSTPDQLSATFTGTVNDTVQVTQVTSFPPNSQGYLTTITLTNVSDTPLTDVKYMRSFDPDNTRYLGGSNTTDNTIGAQYQTDGYSLVSASSLANDAYNIATGHPAVVYLYTSDPRAFVYFGGFTNNDPYVYSNATQARGTTDESDSAIGIVFNAGNLAPGQSTTFSYYTGASAASTATTIHDGFGVIDPTRGIHSPIKDYSSTSSLIAQWDSILRSESFSNAIEILSNLSALSGLHRASHALLGLAAADAGYKGNFGAVAGLAVQGVGSAISANAVATYAKIAAQLGSNPAAKPILQSASRASGIVWLAGAAVTTWGYVGEQASYIDPDSAGETNSYIAKHPDEAVQELGKATVKVFSDLGSAFFGSFL